jgi:hypothetical protein
MSLELDDVGSAVFFESMKASQTPDVFPVPGGRSYLAP